MVAYYRKGVSTVEEDPLGQEAVSSSRDNGRQHISPFISWNYKGGFGLHILNKKEIIA